MKLSTVVAGGAAVATATVLPRGDDSSDSCSVKTVKVSWMKVEQFRVAETWTWDQVTSFIGNSKPDPSQVYPSINKTVSGNGGGGYSAKPAPSSTGGMFNNSTTKPNFSGSRFPTTSSFIKPTGTAGAAPTTTTSGSASLAAAGSSCQNPATRVEWRNLSDNQRDAFVAAIKCLMQTPSTSTTTFPGSQNLYEDLASLHQQLTPQVHGNGIFLVWHRFFVHVFESMLQQKCAYNGPLVWWDETQDAGNFANAPMFTTRWFGEMHAAVDGSAVCVGASGFGEYTANIGPDNSIDNMHCLSRAVDEGQTANTGQSWIDNCKGAQNYDDFRQCNELTYHAYGHNGIGAVMANVAASPEDPSFWLHHGYIDHAYKSWQLGAATRDSEVGGPAPSGGTLTPSDTLTAMGLIPDATVADVLDTQGNYLCYVYDKQ